MNESPLPIEREQWSLANQRYLNGELRRLRLILQRRVLWLRRQWRRDQLQNYQSLVISDARADLLLRGEERQAEARFYAEDAEAVAVSRAIAETEEDLARQARAFAEAGEPPSIDALVELFSLTQFERSVLLLCFATELDPNCERLYAYVQDDLTQNYATPRLALALFGGEGDAALNARDSFLPTAPLRGFRLVTLGQGAQHAATLSARPLRLEERIADYLSGVNQLDERLADTLRPVARAPVAPSQVELIGRVAERLRAGVTDGVWPALNITGERGVGKSAAARSLCERLGLQLYSVNFARVPAAGAELQEAFQVLRREAVMLQFGIYLDATEADAGVEAARKAFVDDALARLDALVVVGSRERWTAEREMLSMQIPKPDTGARRAMWLESLETASETLDGEVEDLIQQFDFGPSNIRRAVESARARARLRAGEGDEAKLTAADLWRACREQAGGQLSELAQRIQPCYTWDDIVLPAELHSLLREIAAQVSNRPKVYESWGFGAKLNRGRGISALFAGSSGTGKTMAAEVLANHLDLDLYRIDLSSVVSKYIGETEKNLRRVFDAAEQSGAILFFDEADALFGKRSEVKDSHDRYANIEINYLLQRMEEYRGMAILATNMKSQMDQAFMRRLRFNVDFPIPDASHRRSIWQKVFPKQADVSKLDYDFLARLEITGGNIRNIAVNAAFLAASEGEPIQMHHILRATRQEYNKIDKLILASEFGDYYAQVK